MSALDPVLRNAKGVWVSASDRGESPLPDLGYRQRRVALPAAVQRGYYTGLANGVLWPTLHGFGLENTIDSASWKDYQLANRAFADEALQVTSDEGLAWVHDYHLMLAPRYLREARPKLRIGWFNHVPWPGLEHFSVLPWGAQILSSLLCADLIGFHTRAYAENFFACAARMGASVDREKGILRSRGGSTRVIVAPIGISTQSIAKQVRSEAVQRETQRLRSLLGRRKIILGIDRLDYTKGIPERLRAYEQMLEACPGLLEQVVLVQVVVPSREEVPAYSRLKREIDRQVGSLNGRLSRTGRVAVHYIYGYLSPTELYAHYRAADVALITPLRDGMNLVAQEFVASRLEEDGALVLSEFAGAADSLDQAHLVNPHDTEATAATLMHALNSSDTERRRRMRSLRHAVESLNVEIWARDFLLELGAVHTAYSSSLGVVESQLKLGGAQATS